MQNFAVVDTNVVVYRCYELWRQGSDSVEDHAKGMAEYYTKFPWIDGVTTQLWIHDSPPYWRSTLLPEYKANRGKKEEDLMSYLSVFKRAVNSFGIPGYEADDIVASIVKLYPRRKTLLCTVDSDWLQLLSENVHWVCLCGAWAPQYRRLNDGSFQQWMNKKFVKLSKKRIGHLDLNSPQSIVDWKVIYGDLSDNIPAREDSRVLIDLLNPPDAYDLAKTDATNLRSLVKLHSYPVKVRDPFKILQRCAAQYGLFPTKRFELDGTT